MFTNFGRDVVFSADLCYNETNEKPPSEREGDRGGFPETNEMSFGDSRVSGGRSLCNFRFVKTFV